MKFKLNLGLRIWILIIVLILAVIAIGPRPGLEGATISSVEPLSPAQDAGMTGPTARDQPINRERILAVQGTPVTNAQEYRDAIAALGPNELVQIRTNRDSYVLTTRNETGLDLVGVRVVDAPNSNIRQGLDLTGGARVMLEPEEPVDDEIMDVLLESLEQRLNVFGLSDVVVRSARDFSGSQFVIVEIAGSSEEEIIELLTSQGEFEAYIGEQLVFSGGDDILQVSRSAAESGVYQCSPAGTEFFCNFRFSITLSPQAAQRHADVTRPLEVIRDAQGGYLNETLDLYLDGANISSLRISSSLRGSVTSQIQITGSGSGASRESAALNAQENMRQLQTVLATGSLPVQLVVVKSDSISPALGEEFLQNILVVGFFAILVIITIVSARYRDWKISIPMSVAMLSELVIVLGIAALIGWNLDLAALAGLIIAIGTGVDDQIIIVDEIKTGGKDGGTWKQRMKNAFFIIFAAFFTLVAAMLPLMWAGAGLVRGFAITTILGVTVGVLVTRPAFAEIAEKFIKME